jgi:tetratricopeptide (TPR) repeat protein
VLSELGRFDATIEHSEAAMRIAEEADHPFTLFLGLVALGLTHLRRGDLPRATRLLERGLDISHLWRDRRICYAAALGAAYALAGRTDEALQRAVEEFHRRPIHFRPAFILLCAGMACLSIGRIDEAAGHAREALMLTRRLGARGNEAHALCLTGDIASRGGADDAEVYYRQALMLAEPRGMRPLIAHCHLGLGKTHRCSGKCEQAQEHLAIATTMYREMDMT